MKKLFSILISLIIILGLTFTLGTENVQAEENDTVLIYFEAPEGWEEPHVWTWDDDGNGAYASLGWPGKAMLEDVNNAGWYYLYIPSNMTNVIINANEGSIQSESFAITGENVWVTLVEVIETVDGVDVTKYNPTAVTTKATTGDLPEYVPTKYIYAYVPIDWDTAALWAWTFDSGVGVFTTWPGEEMTLLDDGWFRYEIPQVADRVIINNFVATDGLQTVDLTVTNDDAYIVVGDVNNDGKYEAEVHAEKPIFMGETFKLYISVPEDWTTPSLWAWSHPDGTGLYTTWPGEEIPYDEEAGYYVATIPTWVNRVIVNNGVVGDDAAQTTDIDVLEAVDSYFVVGEADDEGKFTATISTDAPVDNPIDDPVDDPADEGDSNTLYIIVGTVAVAALVGGVVIFRKR